MNLQTMQREVELENMLKESGLDFKIEKRQLLDSQDLKKTPYYGLKNMKTGVHIHCVKKGYVVSQNEDIIRAVLKGIRGFGDIKVGFGGSINGGRKIFIQLEIIGIEAFGDDKMTKYITIIDSNDGSQAVSVGIGNKMASCTNQTYYFYKHGFSKIRHSKTLEEKMEELPYLITVAMQEHLKMTELYKSFQSTPITIDLAYRMQETILDASIDMEADLFKELSTYKQNQVKKLNKAIFKEISEKGNTVWGLYNGVTRWTTHDRTVPKRENGRLESLMMGTAYKENLKALEFCKELVEAN